MNRQRVLICLVTVWTLCLVCIVVAFAQQCEPDPNKLAANLGWRSTETRDAQGLFHISVNYSGGSYAPNSTMQLLMETAVAEWNVYKCSTWRRF